MKIRKNKIVILIGVLIFSSCHSRKIVDSCKYFLLSFDFYCVTTEYVESERKISLIKFYSIKKVHEYNKGIPFSYELDKSAIGSFDDSTTKNFKKVYFYKENGGLLWRSYDFDSIIYYNILPIKMEHNKWYVILGLYGKDAFIKYDSNNNHIIHIADFRTYPDISKRRYKIKNCEPVDSLNTKL